MSEEGKAICKLLSEKGQAGPDMTHALKQLGNNDMHDGIKRIADYFKKEGELSGYAKGATGVILIGSAIQVVAYVIKRQKQKKEHEKEGKRIVQVLRQPELNEIEAIKESKGEVN